MHISIRAAIVFAIAATVGLAGCSSGQDQDTTVQQGNAGPPAVAGTAPSTTSPNQLTANQVKVDVTLGGAVTLSADAQFIDVPVIIANHGSAMLTSTGPNPVNLGAHGVDASGTIVENDLARAGIPDIAPGGQATVTIKLSTSQTIGKSVQILPVQENVAWFDTWGTKPLIAGPFKQCANAEPDKVCGADGNPLPPAAN